MRAYEIDRKRMRTMTERKRNKRQKCEEQLSKIDGTKYQKVRQTAEHRQQARCQAVSHLQQPHSAHCTVPSCVSPAAATLSTLHGRQRFVANCLT
jgi:hypothetical protein